MDNIRSATPEALSFVKAVTDHKAAVPVSPTPPEENPRSLLSSNSRGQPGPFTCWSLSSPSSPISGLLTGFREAASSEGCHPSPDRVHSHGE